MSDKKKNYSAVQQTRYWCECCKMFVYNNKISRQNHENNPKHIQNFKRKVESAIKSQPPVPKLAPKTTSQKEEYKGENINAVYKGTKVFTEPIKAIQLPPSETTGMGQWQRVESTEPQPITMPEISEIDREEQVRKSHELFVKKERERKEKIEFLSEKKIEMHSKAVDALFNNQKKEEPTSQAPIVFKKRKRKE